MGPRRLRLGRASWYLSAAEPQSLPFSTNAGTNLDVECPIILILTGLSNSHGGQPSGGSLAVLRKSTGPASGLTTKHLSEPLGSLRVSLGQPSGSLLVALWHIRRKEICAPCICRMGDLAYSRAPVRAPWPSFESVVVGRLRGEVRVRVPTFRFWRPGISNRTNFGRLDRSQCAR